jgi:hypothetical protein
MGITGLGMQPHAPDRAGFDAFTALGTFIRQQNDMVFPDQGIFRALLYTESLLAGQADVHTGNLRPAIFYINPGQLGALRTGIVRSGTGEHTESAIRAFHFL